MGATGVSQVTIRKNNVTQGDDVFTIRAYHCSTRGLILGRTPVGRAVDRGNWAPPDVDIDQPSIARVYDYFLGGSHNFASDRAFADRVTAVMPEIRLVLQHNRAFVRRAVRFLLRQGIRQFVDLGSGIPTVGNVHEIAHSVDPRAMVVYVDTDPVAVAHSRALLADVPRAIMIAADLTQPARVLAEPELLRLVDLGQPVGVLLNSVLHFVPDAARAASIVSDFHQAVPAGSYVSITHAGADPQRERLRRTEVLYNQFLAEMVMRSREQITELFGTLSIVEPGVVQLPLWRPDSPEDVGPDATRFPGFGGVGRVE